MDYFIHLKRIVLGTAIIMTATFLGGEFIGVPLIIACIAFTSYWLGAIVLKYFDDEG